MTYPSLKETHYHSSAPSPHFAVLTVPHGAGAEEFLKFFPEIAADSELQAVWPTFIDYLAIERDLGAGELAHSIAASLCARHQIPTMVIEWTYPRGILDGGRLQGHAIRDCLPRGLATRLEESLLALHQQSLDAMDLLYERVRGYRSAFLLDVHTMASYCPVNEQGERKTAAVSFDTLSAYNRQYLEARAYAFERRIDLISDDQHGTRIADHKLTEALHQALQEDGYAVAHNDPYHAAPIYLSYQHMQKVPSLSLDVPKHFIASESESYSLQSLRIDPDKLANLAKTLAAGTAKAFERNLALESSGSP